MDSHKEQKAMVFKKVRVVAWLREKEAGGKAVAREKARLGISGKEKLSATFKVILFEKDLQKTKTCVLCDFSSYEKARKAERLENFLHPETTTDFGVQCTRCSLFQCRICLQELHEFGIGRHPDFEHLEVYLSQPPHLRTLASCSCCSLKTKMLNPIPVIKPTCFKQYLQHWDGVLWFPEYGLVVPTCLGTFDLHALARLSPKENGVLHGLVSQEMAILLEDAGIQATGTTQPKASSTIVVSVMCNELDQNVTVKVKLCLYDRCNTSYTDECLGSDITEQEAQQSTYVLSEEQMREAEMDGIDIVCLIGNPSDPVVKDKFLLVARVLPSSKLLGSIEFDRNALFKTLKEKLPRRGYESRRFGGSSGTARYDKDLFNFLSSAGTTCRKGIGTIVERNGRNWNFIYKSAYSHQFKRVRYSPPVLGGQVDPKRIKWGDKISGFRDAYASTKTLLPYILEAVNDKAGSQFGFARTAIEDELKTIRAAFWKSKEVNRAFKDVIVEKHTITMLLAAVRLHRDKAHRSVKKGIQDYSFLEYKFVFDVPSETGRLKTMASPVARLRGGAGRRRAAVAVATHAKA